MTSLVVIACQTVPITGRSQLQLLPESEETRMGIQAYQQILAKARISHDPVANDLVRRVGSRLAEATGRRDLPWEFKVIEDDRQVNAFALPGGKVAVYTGILPVTGDEAGLAAVLAHEVSHVIAHHGGAKATERPFSDAASGAAAGDPPGREPEGVTICSLPDTARDDGGVKRDVGAGLCGGFPRGRVDDRRAGARERREEELPGRKPRVSAQGGAGGDVPAGSPSDARMARMAGGSFHRRDQAEAPRAARAGEHIDPEGALHQLRPGPVAGARLRGWRREGVAARSGVGGLAEHDAGAPASFPP